MVLNWGLEALKWQLSVATIHRLSFLKSFKAVLSGVAFAVTTPNRIGEYVGRMMYMPEGKRLKVIAVTIIGSLSQILVTLWLGVAGVIWFGKELISKWPYMEPWFWWIIAALIFVAGILTLFYFNVAAIERSIERRIKRASWLYLIEAIQDFGMQRLGVLLLLSLARYLVFAIQYVLLFRLFEVHVPVADLFWIISVVFLILAIIPSIALAELGVRGEVSLQIVGLLTTNSLGIILTSVAVWFINLVVPALAGSILILGVRLFKRRYMNSYRINKQKAEA